jgi:outer membrane receptor protein involved in Fe transport
MSSHPPFRRSIARSIRLLALTVAPLIVPLIAQAQSTGTVSGIVRDGQTKGGLKSASVALRDPADSTAKPLGDLSDDAGAFTIERVPLDRPLRLEVSYVGYTKQVIENVVVTAARPTLALGEILMKPGSVEVEEIQVRAARPDVIVSADKTTYSVENNPTYTATTVSELLGQVPSIDVDPDGKVSLRGDDNVTIMMNDRPMTMPAEQRNKFLQSLPASMVKDIEVRTNPGAQFDAKNSGGIINIVTRRTMSDMIGGNVNAGVDSRVGGNGGAGLYYNGNELNASLSGGGSRGKNGGSSHNVRINYLDSIEQREVGDGISTSTSSSYYGFGQVDYKITASDLVSLSFNVNQWSSDYTSSGEHTFFNAGGGEVLRSFDTNSPGAGSGNSGGYSSASLLFKHTFDGDHKLSLDVGYNGHGYNGTSIYTNTYRRNGVVDSLRSTARNSTFDRSNSTIITTLDYNNPLSQEVTLSVGAKNEINMLDNSTSVLNRDRTSGEFVVDSLQTNHYLPENMINALYTNVAYRPTEAFGIQAGVRVEHATVSADYASGAEIVTRDYTNIFPSGALSYNITEAHSLTLSYRRSVALPDIDALNPTRIRWSDFAENSGNPDLEPEFTNAFELRYNTFWDGGNMISATPYYSTTTGNIENSQRLVDGVSYTTSENFNGSYQLGSQASVSLRPWTWLNFRISGDVYQKVNRGSAVPGDIHSSGTGYNGSLSLNVDPLEGLTISLTGWSSKPALVGGSTTSGHNYWSFSVRQRLFEKKLTISLRVNDPFNLQKWENVYATDDFRTEMSSKWTSRFVSLNFSYTFGTQPRMETHKQEKTETKGSSGSSGGNTSGGSGGQ